MSENRVPAGVPTGGQFAASQKAEAEVRLGIDVPDTDDLDFARETLGPEATEQEVHDLAQQRLDRDRPERPDQTMPPAPLTPRDVEHLIENKGVFSDGYDEDDINRVLGNFEGARLVCVWNEYDDFGYGGDSDFAGMAKHDLGVTAHGHRATADAGVWRSIHPDVWDFLNDPESDVDPESIPSLLSERAFDRQDIDDLSGDGHCNVALQNDQETCAADDCDDDLSDNEGWDGYCGTHADKIANHEDGEHEDDPDDDCPEC